MVLNEILIHNTWFQVVYVQTWMMNIANLEHTWIRALVGSIQMSFRKECSEQLNTLHKED